MQRTGQITERQNMTMDEALDYIKNSNSQKRQACTYCRYG